MQSCSCWFGGTRGSGCCTVLLYVSYVVTNASWSSVYDIRVLTKDKNMKVSLSLSLSLSCEGHSLHPLLTNGQLPHAVPIFMFYASKH